MDSSPSISYSRSPSPTANLLENLSDFNPGRLRQLQQARSVNSVATPAELYKTLHPEASHSDVLHYQTNFQSRRLADFQDNTDIILQRFADSQLVANTTLFDPQRFDFRNLPTNPEERIFQHLTVNELLFQDTGLSKDELFCNKKAAQIQSHLSKTTTSSHLSFKPLSAVEHFSFHYILSQYVKLGEAVQWLCEEVSMLTEGIVDPIRQKYIAEFGEQNPQIKNLDFPKITQRLNGLQEFSNRVCFLTTVPEELLDLHFQNSSPPSEILEKIRHNERCRPLSRKKQTWKRSSNPCGRIPQMQIVKEVPHPADFSFTIKPLDKPSRQLSSGNKRKKNASRYHGRISPAKTRRNYHRSQSAHRRRSRSKSQGRPTSRSRSAHAQRKQRHRSRSFSKNARRSSSQSSRFSNQNHYKNKSVDERKKAAKPPHAKTASLPVSA